MASSPAGSPAPKTAASAMGEPVDRYLVVKHAAGLASWKGRYKRVLDLSNTDLLTRNPGSFEITNSYRLVDEVVGCTALPGGKDDFEIHVVKGGKKAKKYHFSSPHRSQLISRVLDLKERLGGGVLEGTKGKAAKASRKVSEAQGSVEEWRNCTKWKRTGETLAIDIRLGMWTVDVLVFDSEAGERKLRSRYPLVDISGVARLEDEPGREPGFVLYTGDQMRAHVFFSRASDAILDAVRGTCSRRLGHEVSLLPRSPMQIVVDRRLGRISSTAKAVSSDSQWTDVPSVAEYSVSKLGIRVRGGASGHVAQGTSERARHIQVTEKHLLERDPQTYNAVVHGRWLEDVFAIVRYHDDPLRFAIEYRTDEARVEYRSSHRDALIVAIVDQCRWVGNFDVEVRRHTVDRGLRCGPLSQDVVTAEGDLVELACRHLQDAADLALQPGAFDAQRQSQIFAYLRYFNSNVPFSGRGLDKNLDHGRMKAILAAVDASIDLIGVCLPNPDGSAGPKAKPVLMVAVLLAARRLAVTKVGYEAFLAAVSVSNISAVNTRDEGSRRGSSHGKHLETFLPRLWRAVRSTNEDVAASAADMVGVLMQPLHEEYEPSQVRNLKSELLSQPRSIKGALDLLSTHARVGSGAVVVANLMDILAFTLCDPYNSTTDPGQFNSILNLVAEAGSDLFRLFLHPCSCISKSAGMIMQAVIEDSMPDVSRRMQEAAVREGALLRHLQTSLFMKAEDRRSLTQRNLSRHLVALWTAENAVAHDVLSRIIPAAALAALKDDEKPPRNEEEERLLAGGSGNDDDGDRKNKKQSWWSSWRLQKLEKKHAKRLQAAAVPELQSERKKTRDVTLPPNNWPWLFYQLSIDHARPDLIWNHQTREELREALEAEIRLFTHEQEVHRGELVSWNHVEFEVMYPSLRKELVIGGCYIRLLLDESVEPKIADPSLFFNELYHALLRETARDMRLLCLQSLTIIYKHYGREVIGHFVETPYILAMLRNARDRALRDRLLLFLEQLLSHRINAKLFVDNDGIPLLVEFLTLCHLQTDVSHTPLQSDLIEASSSQLSGTGEKEWYYQQPANDGSGTGEKERVGPLSLEDLRQLYAEKQISNETRCWAQGMDAWGPLVDVPPLRWELVADHAAVLTYHQLGTRVLNMLNRLCTLYPSRDEVTGALVRPLPRAKMYLSQATVLPYIVQTLLTYDAGLVDSAAQLLISIVEDHPYCMSKLYLTGIFYFALLYPGSNILRLVRLLKLSHTRQAYREEDKVAGDEQQKRSTFSEMTTRSILSGLLPEAMVCFLDEYGTEKFAEIFLGDFDTPEVIWSHEMRRLMMEKVALHLGNLILRLKVNPRAVYSYCPFPPIQYPELEDELFVHVFYLRNLCNTERFPTWEIKEPIAFLQSTLLAWKRELAAKAPTLSEADALSILKLEPEKLAEYTENQVRRAYFRQAQKYHPDKNPDESARDIFEKIHIAYKLLSARFRKSGTQQTPLERIHLLLSSQNILFERYATTLTTYKYAGYPMLLSTLRVKAYDVQKGEHDNNSGGGGTFEELVASLGKQESVADGLPEALDFNAHSHILEAGTRLMRLSVETTPSNAEEFVHEKGLSVLSILFSRVVSIIRPPLSGQKASKTPSEVNAEKTCANLLSTFTALGRRKSSDVIEHLLHFPVLVKDIVRCLFFRHSPLIMVAALRAVRALSAHGPLQQRLYDAGAAWHTIPLMFRYDYTLEEGGVEKSADTNVQEVDNRLAKFAVTALSRLAGYRVEKIDEHDDAHLDVQPDQMAHCDAVRRCVKVLFPPYFYRLLSHGRAAKFLSELSNNHENPLVIWNNALRKELSDYVDEQLDVIRRTGEFDPQAPFRFTYSALKDELVVDDVYIRVYNDDHHRDFVPENPKRFNSALVSWLRENAALAFPADAKKSARHNQQLRQQSPKKPVDDIPMPVAAAAPPKKPAMDVGFDDVFGDAPVSIPAPANPDAEFNPFAAGNAASGANPAAAPKSSGDLFDDLMSQPSVASSTTAAAAPTMMDMASAEPTITSVDEPSLSASTPPAVDMKVYTMRTGMVVSALRRLVESNAGLETDLATPDVLTLLASFLLNDYNVPAHEHGYRVWFATLQLFSTIFRTAHLVETAASAADGIAAILCSLMYTTFSVSIDMVDDSVRRACASIAEAAGTAGADASTKSHANAKPTAGVMDAAAAEERPILAGAIGVCYQLASRPEFVIALQNHGALLYLTRILIDANSGLPVRACALMLLAKMVGDRVHGAKVALMAHKLLPEAFVDVIRESPSAAVRMYDQDHENPELVWNAQTRMELTAAVDTVAGDYDTSLRPLYTATRSNASGTARIDQMGTIRYTMPAEYRVDYALLRDELVIGGVYVRIFVQQPQWNLRKPKPFLLGLLEKYSETVSRAARIIDGKPVEGVKAVQSSALVAVGVSTAPPPGSVAACIELLDTLAKCFVGLLQTQAGLADHVAAAGHVSKLFDLLVRHRYSLSANTGASKADVDQALVDNHSRFLKSTLMMLRQLAESETCVSYMIKSACVKPIVDVFTVHASSPLICPLSIWTLEQMFSRAKSVLSVLVVQALRCDLVPHALKLLDNKTSPYKGEDAPALRARVVNLLKTMLGSVDHRPALSQLLDGNPLWEPYRDQSYDLFIGTTNQDHLLLTAGDNDPRSNPSQRNAVSGLLTSGAGQGMGMASTTRTDLPDAPPPM